MTKLQNTIERGLAADRPAVGAEGRLYASHDLGIVERDNVTEWESYGFTGSSGGA